MTTNQMDPDEIPNILIVDDVPTNLTILSSVLKHQGYRVRPVPNGSMALLVAEKEKPDLILLDIMMPEMDGFEVCRRLKENPSLSDVPVIFISALNDTSDIVKALRSGGVDYISKPFRADEVIARVGTHLKLSQQSKMLKKQSAELQDLITTKDKFFSIIAHDLRGPLGGFMGLTEMMSDESISLPPEQLRELSVDLCVSARNIYNLLENLLEWARMQKGQIAFNPEKLTLSDVVAECAKSLADSIRAKSIQLTIDIPENHEVFADSNMIQSVLRNLVSNAIKFTPKGGEVRISAHYTEINTTVVVVKDTGIGMNKEMIANLFLLSTNNSRPGTEGEHSTGLGLHLCKEFIDKHEGELWVESEVGKGTSFYFTIPDKGRIIDKLTNQTNSLPDEAHNLLENLKILIAEDNKNSEIFMRIVTSSFSNRILSASTGLEAVELCRNNPDLDLILMDIKMPDLDGYNATKQIRQFNKKVVIIAQTAFGTEGDREMAIAAGCDDYISKPIDKSLLIELILKHFKK
jgi:CheY-like chemotaxis protein